MRRPNFHQARDLPADEARALFEAMSGYRDAHPQSTATSLMHALLPPAPADVLEVGPGNGEDAAGLAAGGYRVTGLDVRDDMAAPDGWTLLVGDATAMPVPDAAVDAVTANRVIHHLPRLDRFLDESNRVLRRGGLVVVSWPDRFTLDAGDRAVNAALHAAVTHGRDTAAARSTGRVVEEMSRVFAVTTVAQVWHTVTGEDVLGYASGRLLREELVTTLPREVRRTLETFTARAHAGDAHLRYAVSVVAGRRS